MAKLLCLLTLLLLSESAASQTKTPIHSLQLLGKYTVPHRTIFKGTTIGGLSGIDYDSRNDFYYIISDDRSAINPARFYTAKIHLSPAGIDSVQFLDVYQLRMADGRPYPSTKSDPLHTPDPEAIRYNPATQQLIWTSEGERIINSSSMVLLNPSLTISSTTGNYIDTLAAPVNTRMHAIAKGTRQNGGFESLTFSRDKQSLFYSVELPLYEDGPEPSTTATNSWIRIYETDMKSGKNTAQYAYRPEPVAFPPEPSTAFKVNGMADLLAVGDMEFLTVERSFSMGRLSCTIKVFLTDLRKADNVIGIASLSQTPPAHPASKQLLLNMDDLGIYIDNVEGVSFGPELPNGHRTLIFVADDNFQALEKTQFLLFEIL